MLFNELPITFPWYERKDHQTRYTDNASIGCDFKLITPKNAMLPFVLYKPIDAGSVTAWRIYQAYTDVLVNDLQTSIAVIFKTVRNGNDYYVYDGRGLNGLLLTPGLYYSQLNFADGQVRYSEIFDVPLNSFTRVGDLSIDYLKLEWWNDSDIAPILYNFKDNTGKPHFTNVLYLDEFLICEPVYEEENTPDGNNQPIVQSSTVAVNYSISTVVPEWVKKAAMLIRMHGHVKLTTKYGRRSGEINNVHVTATTEDNGAYSTLDIVFTDTLYTNEGCDNNMP